MYVWINCSPENIILASALEQQSFPGREAVMTQIRQPKLSF